MKRFIAFACILVLALSLLPSCDKASGASDSSAEPKKSDFEIAEEAYALLEQAEQLCIDGMDDIYNAWKFGIYDADDCSISSIFSKLSYETSFSASELETNGGYDALYLVYGDSNWQYCIWTVENCLEARGDFAQVDSLLTESKSLIQSISSEYEYYSAFRDYYSKVSSYAEFFKEPTGSFEQLVDTINDYENGIRTAKEIFKFDFE